MFIRIANGEMFIENTHTSQHDDEDINLAMISSFIMKFRLALYSFSSIYIQCFLLLPSTLLCVENNHFRFRDIRNFLALKVVRVRYAIRREVKSLT